MVTDFRRNRHRGCVSPLCKDKHSNSTPSCPFKSRPFFILQNYKTIRRAMLLQKLGAPDEDADSLQYIAGIFIIVWATAAATAGRDEDEYW